MRTVVSLVPPLLIFICLHAGIVKLAARLLRYTLSWKRSFVFALAMLIIAMGSRALQFAIGHSLPLWLALIFLLAVYLALGAWLFAERATKWIPVKVVRVVAALIYAILGILTLTGYSRVNL